MGVIGRKYGNKKSEEDGYVFDSLAERREYRTLKLRQIAGEISDLAVHPRYDLWVGDVKICTYIADFRYQDRATGKCVVVDVKGVKTAAYGLKKKLMFALFGIKVLEVKA